MSLETPSSEARAGGIPELQGRKLLLDQIRQALNGIRFGEVRLVIQDAVVVQIERSEKLRLR